MAVVVENRMEGGSQEMYEQVSPKVMPEGQLPEGCQLHLAGPIDEGWRVITVWESEDQFKDFLDNKLRPALEERGGGDVTPNIEVKPVHRLITS